MKSFLLFCVCLVPATSSFGDDWPQWRGPNRTDVSNESGLLKKWPEAGPNRIWMSKQGGLGYSGFSVVGERLFTMGLEIDGNDEFVLCLDANSGKKLWQTTIGDRLKNNWGDGPRSTPTIDGDRCYALSGKGSLACLSITDGKLIWKKEFADVGGKVPVWGFCESVLVDGDQVVCTPGGTDGALMALDKMTGEVRWFSSEFKTGAQYSSIVKADIHGQPQYIQLTMKALVGVSPKDGSLLWKTDWPGRVAVIPTPIVSGNRIYISSGYSVGCRAIEIGKDMSVSDVYDNKVMVNHHGGVIHIDGHVYGYSDSRRYGWTCQNLETGEAVWSDSRVLGKGAIAFADGKFYCLSESKGEVVLIDATTSGWKESGRFTLSPQTENRSPKGKVWVHPVIANGKLYLRDQELIYCYDIKQ